MILSAKSIFQRKFPLSKVLEVDQLIISELQSQYTHSFKMQTITKTRVRIQIFKLAMISINNITHKKINKIMIIKDKFKISNLMRNNYN